MNSSARPSEGLALIVAACVAAAGCPSEVELGLGELTGSELQISFDCSASCTVHLQMNFNREHQTDSCAKLSEHVRVSLAGQQLDVVSRGGATTRSYFDGGGIYCNDSASLELTTAYDALARHEPTIYLEDGDETATVHYYSDGFLERDVFLDEPGGDLRPGGTIPFEWIPATDLLTESSPMTMRDEAGQIQAWPVERVDGSFSLAIPDDVSPGVVTVSLGNVSMGVELSDFFLVSHSTWAVHHEELSLTVE